MLTRGWPEPIERLLTLQLREPMEEQAIRATLPVLTPIEDPVSRAVQAQYEENPYPRWVLPAPAVKAIADDLVQNAPAIVGAVVKGTPAAQHVDPQVVKQSDQALQSK